MFVRIPIKSLCKQDQVSKFGFFDSQMHHHDGIVPSPRPLYDGPCNRIHEHTIPYHDGWKAGAIKELLPLIIQRQDCIESAGFCGGGYSNGP